MSGWLAGRGFDSAGQGADLDEVAGEDAVPARGSAAGDTGQFGAVPTAASFEVVEPSLGSDSPSAELQRQTLQRESLTGKTDFGLIAGNELEFGNLLEPLVDEHRQLHTPQMRTETAVGAAAESPVPVHFTIHDQLVGGDRVAAVAVDRCHA